MRINECIPTENNINPQYIPDFINLRYTCKLTELEKRCLTLALSLLSIRLEQKKPVLKQLFVYFYDRDTLTYDLSGDSNRGYYVSQVFLPVHRWKKYNCSATKITIAILEELSHAVWQILDEVEAKYEVWETIQPLLREFNILVKIESVFDLGSEPAIWDSAPDFVGELFESWYRTR